MTKLEPAPFTLHESPTPLEASMYLLYFLSSPASFSSHDLSKKDSFRHSRERSPVLRSFPSDSHELLTACLAYIGDDRPRGLIVRLLDRTWDLQLSFTATAADDTTVTQQLPFTALIPQQRVKKFPLKS
jgi:hypothetical protein